MPELPEVERARRLVDERIVGAVVVDVSRPVVDDKVFVDVEPGEFERALAGRAVVASARHGKQLWWRLRGDDAATPCFHFGMTGAFVLRGCEGLRYYNSRASGAGEWPPRFAKLVVGFDNGVELAYVDPRRFGKIRLVSDVRDVIGGLGPDPLLEMPDAETFAKIWTRRSAPIKTALMDQKLLAGVGNWMADEILYRARVHPETRANELGESQLEAIRERIIEVVTVACDANSDHDLFPDDWLFHHRWGKTDGAKVNGDAIKFIEVGGRTTAFVPKLQFKTDRPASTPKPKTSTKKRAAIKVEIKSEPSAEPRAELRAEPRSEPRAEPSAEPRSEPGAAERRASRQKRSRRAAPAPRTARTTRAAATATTTL